MNKSELIDVLAKATGKTKVESEKFLNAFIGVVEETLANDEEIKLVGFGSFQVRQRKEREVVNPKNREERIMIPASKAVKFTAGKALRDVVNN